MKSVQACSWRRKIVQILDSNLDAPEPYIVTPFYSAGELLSESHSTVKPFSRDFDFSSTSVRGVAYAHENGMTSLYLKPSNIFINGDGTPVVGDFGLCFIADAGAVYTPQ